MKQNKKYKIVQSGPKKKYTCEGPGCKYSISALRLGFCKHPRSRKDVPTGAWYVSIITGEHSQHCQMMNMAGSMSSTNMVANKEFRSAMLVPNVLFVGIHWMVHKNKAVVMGKKATGLIQRARKKYDSMENQDVKESYAEIPSFLRALKKKNPESRVCLQMDSQGRFYRFFLSYPFLIFRVMIMGMHCYLCLKWMLAIWNRKQVTMVYWFNWFEKLATDGVFRKHQCWSQKKIQITTCGSYVIVLRVE